MVTLLPLGTCRPKAHRFARAELIPVGTYTVHKLDLAFSYFCVSLIDGFPYMFESDMDPLWNRNTKEAQRTSTAWIVSMGTIGSKLEESNLVRSLRSKSPFLYALCGEMWDGLRNLWARAIHFSWRLSRSQIAQTARIHPSAYVSSFKVKIGSGCVIGPHAVVLENSILEDNVELGPGCVVGSEGFVGHALGSKVIMLIHIGGVHIHRGVRIQSLSCVDKSTDGGYTEIGEESCIGEQVHIGHNVRLGRRCRVESQAELGGHVIYGDDVRICSNATVVEMLVIGNSARIGPGAVVTKNVQDSGSVSGNFAIDSEKHRNFVRSAAEGRIGWLA